MVCTVGNFPPISFFSFWRSDRSHLEIRGSTADTPAGGRQQCKQPKPSPDARLGCWWAWVLAGLGVGGSQGNRTVSWIGCLCSPEFLGSAVIPHVAVFGDGASRKKLRFNKVIGRTPVL